MPTPKMDSLGANILVLPKSATLQNYYAADMQGDTIPEEYVTQLALSSLQGLDNLSPKLPLLAPWALLISVGLTLVASYFPARRAACLDPCATFQEI